MSGTHSLGQAVFGTAQDMGTKGASKGDFRTAQDTKKDRASERNLLIGEGRGLEWSGHRKQASELLVHTCRKFKTNT